MDTSHANFLRFEKLLHQACEGFQLNTPLVWNVTTQGYSPEYVRIKLRQAALDVLSNPDWQTTLDRELLQQVISTWYIRTTEDKTSVELGPRKRNFKVIDIVREPDTQPTLVIDGSNPAYLNAICLLKNFEQIPASFPIRLLDVPLTSITSLNETYPNLEFVQDILNGIPQPNYILI